MSKLLIALLLCLPLAAQAENFAYGQNRAGGYIWLTDTDCPEGNTGKIAYSADKHGSGTIFGCWLWVKPNVIIKWESGNVSTLPGSMFELADKKTTY